LWFLMIFWSFSLSLFRILSPFLTLTLLIQRVKSKNFVIFYLDPPLVNLFLIMVWSQANKWCWRNLLSIRKKKTNFFDLNFISYIKINW
jgi:hypothetical protein